MMQKAKHKKKPALLKDIAEATGVSLSTVSRALNDRYENIGGRRTTADLIKRVAREMGFRPHAHATALARCNAMFDTIGMLVSGIGRWTVHPLLGACYHELNQAGKIMSLASLPGYDSPPQSIRMLKTMCLDGLIVAYAPPRWLLEELNLMRLPMVFINAFDQVPVNSFWFDDFQGGQLAVEHLVSLGHRRIQYLNASNAEAHYSVRRRFDGYCDAMRKSGLAVPEGAGQLISDEADFRPWLERCLAGPGAATALVCYSSHLARRCLIWAYHTHRLVPGDLSLVDLGGHGESLLMIPPLTEIQLPVEELVRCAVRQLLDMVEEKAGNIPSQCFRPQLVIRQSTAQPKLPSAL